MSDPNPTASVRGKRRGAPRRLSAALTALLRAHRPPATTDEQHVWICLTPATAAAIARVAARRHRSLDLLRDHPVHEAARGPTRVTAQTASQWRRDAWQAADEGVITVTDALLLDAQVDPPGAA